MRFLSLISRCSLFMARLNQGISVALLVLMVIVTFNQVIFRYVLNNSLDWSEEAARYLFVWTCYIGMSFAMHSGSHLEVTVLRGRLGKNSAKYMAAFSCAVTALFCLVVGFFGIDAVSKFYMTQQTTVALQLENWIVWLCLPIGFFMTFIQALLRTILILGGSVNPEGDDAILQTS